MALSDAVNKSPFRAKPAAGRPGRGAAALGSVRRTTALLVLAAVVLSLNLVAGNGSATERPADFSETAQAAARTAAVELARQAREAARTSADPLAAELARQAQTLTEQTLLLAPAGALPPEAPAAGALAAGSPAAGAPLPDSGSGLTALYVQTLAASARSSLNAALAADGGTARLLASTGAAQQVLAVRAAEAAGLDAPQPWAPAAGSAAPAGDSPCGAGADSTGAGGPEAGGHGSTAPDGGLPDAADALQGALDAEYGAAYADEVAMARTPAADSRAELARTRQEHLAAAAQGVQLLPELCLPALSRTPAYSLPASFTADPAGALARMEASLPAVYADLAALGTGAVRVWAVERLTDLSARLSPPNASVPAAPGLGAEPVKAPWAAGGTSL